VKQKNTCNVLNTNSETLDTHTYRGRFAPAPSGPLHFGSIIAALGSFLQARSQNGLWLIRIEDSDSFRTQSGAKENILKTLEALELHWDENIIVQSERESLYQQALNHLGNLDLLYPCICSRKETKGKPYNGQCRHGIPKNKQIRSTRLKTRNENIIFNDLIQGDFSQTLETDIGDFIVNRVDGITAYHLAVVVDDDCQHVSEVVRGADLLDSTPRQIYLQQLLGYKTPTYCHLPVATNSKGQKISKQNHAPATDINQPVLVLYKALQFLGQEPNFDLLNGKVGDIISWGIQNWDINKIPKQQEIKINDI